MFENSEQLLEFVEIADEVVMDQVFESTIADACLYEDEYIAQALDKYVEMLESDNVDEKFEEHLSTVLVPYFASSAAFYEGAMVIEEGKLGQAVKFKTQLAKAYMTGKKGKIKTDIGMAKKKVGEKLTNLKGAVGKKVAAAKEGFANKAFDAKFKARGMMKSMRHKYGPKALANKIKRGYQSAVKWAKESKLGKKIQGAIGAGMVKRSKALAEKVKKKAETGGKLLAASGATA